MICVQSLFSRLALFQASIRTSEGCNLLSLTEQWTKRTGAEMESLSEPLLLISGTENTGSGPLWLPCPHYEELLGFSFP